VSPWAILIPLAVAVVVFALVLALLAVGIETLVARFRGRKAGS
jgi:hypothetical protein